MHAHISVSLHMCMYAYMFVRLYTHAVQSYSCRVIGSIRCARTDYEQAYTNELFVSTCFTACVCMRTCLCDAHIV